VAKLALCMARVLDCGVLCVHDGSHRRDISHQFSGCESREFWRVGCFVARFQSSCYGM
jgi:hypothetical protein